MNAKKKKDIANLRIQFERAINRIKFLWILEGVIPVTMVHHIDDIVVTCAALSNLKPKLIQKKSNWDHSCFFVFVCFFVCFFFFFAFNHVNAKKKRSQLDFFWVNFVFKCDKTGQPKKCFFFQNEYVGDFATVIAGKEIIFLNLISSIESGP